MANIMLLRLWLRMDSDAVSGGEVRSGHSNLIDVYTGRLRRKIDEGERVALLATLRGSGLLLEVPARASRSRSKAVKD